jgi:hypothetical protein
VRVGVAFEFGSLLSGHGLWQLDQYGISCLLVGAGHSLWGDKVMLQAQAHATGCAISLDAEH